MRRIRVVDSHTGGEGTRVVLAGGPDLGGGSLEDRVERFRSAHDEYRTAIVGEPRGGMALIGALLCAPTDLTCVTGVVFFDNAGYLGMCGHGAIGLVATLSFLSRLGRGRHRVETPVGTVGVELHEDGRVTIDNVPSHRLAHAVSVEVPGQGRVTGDVAWGGNWFFLAEAHGLALRPENVDALTDFAWQVRCALAAAGITGTGGAEIDHVELCADSPVSGLDSRNFVLCPGKAYDRSPCGTGTSARIACLHAEGRLRPGEVWRQESITGSVFEARFSLDSEGRVRPRITGRAYVTGEATLLLDDEDPLCWGFRGGAWPGAS